ISMANAVLIRFQNSEKTPATIKGAATNSMQWRVRLPERLAYTTPLRAKRISSTPVARMSQFPVSSPDLNLVRYSPAISAAAGNTGRMYAGNFDLENEKKISGTKTQASAKTRSLFCGSSARHCQLLASATPATSNAVQGTDIGTNMSR